MNTRTFFIILLLIPIFSSARIQDTLYYSNQNSINLSSYIGVKRLTKDSLSLRGIIKSSHIQPFQKLETNNLIITKNFTTCWLNFTIKNINQHSNNIFIEFKNPNLYQIQVFVRNGNMLYYTKQSTSKKAFTSKQIKSLYFVKQLILEPNTLYDIYIKINQKYKAQKIPIILYGQKEYMYNTNVRHLQEGLFYGIFISIILFSLFYLMLNYNHIGQIYFLIYMLILGFLFFNLDGLSFLYIFNNHPSIPNKFINSLPFLSMALFGSFYIKFIYRESKKYVQIQYIKIINYLNYSLGLLAFSTFIIVHDIELILLLDLTVLWILIFTLNYKDRSRKLTHKIYFNLSFYVISLIVLLFLIELKFESISYLDIQLYVETGIIIQFILISLSILNYLRTDYRKTATENIKNLEKINTIRERTNIELEQKVKERTNTLINKNKELEELIKEKQKTSIALNKQKNEIQRKNQELELAFKKSSSDHVKLQKMLYINQEQQEKLKKSFDDITEKNTKLEQQNEEILSQRDKISNQNKLLEIKNKDITDSILYAEQIQKSIIPQSSKLLNLFSESFIFFKPKERLSGDFYWFDKIKVKQETFKIVAAIDCTGHGVPGALMSIIARDGIQDAIKQNKYMPHDIINHISKITIQTLNKKHGKDNLKDGMDLTVISINESQQKIYFSGARNPIYIHSNNALNEYKGSIYSAGSIIENQTESLFTTTEIDYKNGDYVYMFSDGYPDQFGGIHGNKLRYSRFKTILESIINLPENTKQKKLNDIIKKWQNSNEQVDDMLIIGIKL